MSNIYELAKAEYEAYDEFRKYIEGHMHCPVFEQSKMEAAGPGKSLQFNELPKLKWDPKVFDIPNIKLNASWVGGEPIAVKPGDTITLNWSHEASEALGKVKSVDFHNGRGLTVHLETDAPKREWIEKLIEEKNLKIREKVWRNILDFDWDAIYDITQEDSDRLVITRKADPCEPFMINKTFKVCCDDNPFAIGLGGKDPVRIDEDALDKEPQYRVRTPEEQRQYELERDAIDACTYAFENLKLSLRSAQDKEIAKYSVKDKSELMTPYDIWEQNKIEKGELPMTTYDVAYNEKKAAAQKAYDEAMLAAKKAKEEAAQKEANETAAKSLKGMYDAYVDAGFTPEQAEKFVTIALEKVASKI